MRANDFKFRSGEGPSSSGPPGSPTSWTPVSRGATAGAGGAATATAATASTSSSSDSRRRSGRRNLSGLYRIFNASLVRLVELDLHHGPLGEIGSKFNFLSESVYMKKIVFTQVRTAGRRDPGGAGGSEAHAFEAIVKRGK